MQLKEERLTHFKDPYIGMDQSLSRSGVAVLSPIRNYTLYFTTKTTHEYSRRLISIREKVKDLIIKEKPITVFLEETYIGKNTHVACLLVGVEVVLQVACYELNQPLRIIRPANWRKALQLENNKDKAIAALSKQCESKNEHAIEAVGVLLGGLVSDGTITIETSKKLYFYES